MDHRKKIHTVHLDIVPQHMPKIFFNNVPNSCWKLWLPYKFFFLTQFQGVGSGGNLPCLGLLNGKQITKSNLKKVSSNSITEWKVRSNADIQGGIKIQNHSHGQFSNKQSGLKTKLRSKLLAIYQEKVRLLANVWNADISQFHINLLRNQIITSQF